MDAKIKRFKQIYSCFVDRPLDGVLVVTTNDLSTVFIVHAVADLDGRSHEDLEFSVAEPFETPDQVADLLVGRVQAQQAAVAAQVHEDGVDEELLARIRAPLPAACTDPSVPAAERIRRLISEVHDRVGGGERRITWCLSPAEIRDAASYGILVRELLQMPRPPGLRLVLRDRDDDPCVTPGLVDPADESVITTNFSITLSEMKEAAAQRAADTALPLESRLPALLEVASAHFVAGRIDEAERAYHRITSLAATDSIWVAPLAWHGLAEIARARGERSLARAHLERGLMALGDLKVAPIQYTVINALGRVSAELEDYATAEACFLCSASLAAQQCASAACAEALDALGDARLARGEHLEARNAWEAAVDLSREEGHREHERALLRKLEALSLTDR